MAFKQYKDAPVKTILTGAEKIHITDIDGTLKQVSIDSIGPETESIVSDNSNKVPTSAAIKAFVESKMDDVKMPIEVESAIETHGMGWTDTEEKAGFDIQWDGNTKGLERVEDYVKISDLDIPNDQIVGLKYDGSLSDTHEVYTTYEMTLENFEQLAEFGVINDDYAFVDYWIIAHKDGIVFDRVEFPHKGIYVADPENVELYISRIYKEASTEEVVHKIDQKYIPQGSGGGGMVVNVTVNGIGVGEITADKSFDEIKNSYFANNLVVADVYLDGEIISRLMCVQADPISAIFGFLIPTGDSYTPALSVIIDEDTGNDVWMCGLL